MRETRDLNISAARLLCTLYEYGEMWNTLSIEQQMQAIGTRNRKDFYDARKTLDGKGFVSLEMRMGSKTTLRILPNPIHVLSSANGDVGGGDRVILYNSNIGEGKNGLHKPVEDVLVTLEVTPTSYPEGNYASYPEGNQLPLRQLPTSYPEGNPPPVTEKVTSYPEGSYPIQTAPSLIDRCREVDAMDDGGDIAVRTSPAQKRRKAQIPLLQEAWSLYFPHDNRLLPENAKLFLNLNGDSATEVLLDIEDRIQKNPTLQEKGSTPLGYFKARFRGRAAQGEQGVPQKVQSPTRTTGSIMSSAVSVLERPKVGAGAYIPGGDLPPASPEYLEALKESNERFERMKREKGWVE